MKKIPHARLLKLLEKHPIEFEFKSSEYINIRNLFDNENLIKAEWLNQNKNWNWHDAPQISDTDTYTGCLYANITSKNDGILLDLIVFDGDSYDGSRTNLRCSFLFSIGKKSPILEQIKLKLLDELYRVAKDSYKNIQRKQEQFAIEAIFNDILFA